MRGTPFVVRDGTLTITMGENAVGWGYFVGVPIGIALILLSIVWRPALFAWFAYVPIWGSLNFVEAVRKKQGKRSIFISRLDDYVVSPPPKVRDAR